MDARQSLRPNLESLFHTVTFIRNGWLPLSEVVGPHYLNHLLEWGAIEVRVDVNKATIKHEETRGRPPMSPESEARQIRHKTAVMRRRAAYVELCTLPAGTSIKGIRHGSYGQEYTDLAFAFVKSLYDAVHECYGSDGPRITHMVMGTQMYHVYNDAIQYLSTVSPHQEFIRKFTSEYRLGNVIIIPSLYVSINTPYSIYVVDARCALHIQGDVIMDTHNDVEGSVPITIDHRQFMLLSKDNARASNGSTCRIIPGFVIGVDSVW